MVSQVKKLFYSFHLPVLSHPNWSAYAWIRYPITVFLLSRLIIFGAAFIGDAMLPTEPGHWNPAPENIILNLGARWDSQWYTWIIDEGYRFRPEQRSNVAFFPVYPLLVRAIAPLLGHNIILTGVLASNIAFLAGLLFLYKLTCLEFGDEGIAQRAIYYLAVFPTSFFFSAIYTESLFLLFSVAAIYLARKRSWVWAALMGLLASGTRSVGIFVWGLVMWEWLRVQGWDLEAIHHRQAWLNLKEGSRRNWFQVLVLLIIPLGLVSYIAFLQINFHEPLAFVTVQSAWDRENVGPWTVIIKDLNHLFHQEFNRGNTSRLLNVVTLLAVPALSPFLWRKLGAGYAIYALLLVLLPASSASMSMIRYVIVVFPVFMVLGDWGRHPLVDKIITTIFTALLGVLTTVFVNWIFVA